MKKLIRIVRLFLVTSVIIMQLNIQLVYCLASNPEGQNQPKNIMELTKNILIPAEFFLKENKRWPKDIEELKLFINNFKKEQLPDDVIKNPTYYKRYKFTIMPDGSFRVFYKDAADNETWIGLGAAGSSLDN